MSARSAMMSFRVSFKCGIDGIRGFKSFELLIIRILIGPIYEVMNGTFPRLS